jgi:hypothetical protein
MPILNVIDILLRGAGSHFEKRLVDVFLAIPVNKIVHVFLSETRGKIEPEDEKILSNYNLLDIYNFASAETLNEEQSKVLSLFNLYYAGKTKEEVAQ